MATKFEFQTPPGRLVSGSLFEHQTKDHQGKDKEQSKWNFFIALAFPKTAAAWWDEPDNGPGSLGNVFNALRQAAGAGFTRGEPQQPGFKWKIDDGDSPKHVDKTGYKGHWVLKFNRAYSIGAPRVFNNQQPAQQIVDPAQAKRGHWYRVSGSSSGNDSTGEQAGVYVNMDLVQWLAYDEEIVGGANPDQVFTTQVQLPPGASATPVAGAGGMPAPPGGGTPAQAASPAPVAPAASPQPGVVPAPNFATGGGYNDAAPAAPAASPAPAAPVKYQYQGVAYTAEQLKAGGHTDEMIATYPQA